MNSPYTEYPTDALVAAQSSVGAALSAVLLARPIRPWMGTLLMLAAVWLVALLPVEPKFVAGLGFTITPGHAEHLLKVAPVLATCALAVCLRPGLVAFAFVGQLVLFKIAHIAVEAEPELAGLELAWFGLLVGLHLRHKARSEARRSELRPDSYGFDEVKLFLLAVALAALVSTVVLERRCDSADEWSYTYQAALFWRGRAYSAPSPCTSALENYWIFVKEGRQFSQYTPGWPLFLAPFFGMGAIWLGGPVSLGLLVVGVGRLARRAAADFGLGSEAPTQRQVRAAGVLAALVTMFGSTMLINAGSRFPHVFVAAMFAWAIEAVCRVGGGDLEAPDQWLWGLLLGLSTGFMISSRPADGATLGLGIFVYFVYLLVRGRLGWRAFVGTSLGFGAIGSLSLVILRLQLGHWFTTGYSLSESFHPDFKVSYSLPKPEDLKWVLPLATGSYCWWPCSPALGLAGWAGFRRRGLPVAAMLGAGSILVLVYYGLLEFGRGWDFGYGPRYRFVLVVPMAVGTGVLLAPLWSAARGRFSAATPLVRAGPVTLALAAMLVGVVRIAPLVYPFNYRDVHLRSTVFDAAEKSDLAHALVVIPRGLLISDPRDQTQNLPLDVYPNQRVVYAADEQPELLTCLRNHFPDRKVYRAVGMRGSDDVTFVPE